MKKIFLIAIFAILSSCNYAYAQKVEVDQTFVDDAAKAFKLVVEQRDAIDKLQITVAQKDAAIAELERQKTTPCSIAQEKLRVDALFWTNEFKVSDPADKSYRKQIEKNLKQTRHLGAKAIQSACGFTEKSALETAWDIIKPFLPVAAVLLK